MYLSFTRIEDDHCVVSSQRFGRVRSSWSPCLGLHGIRHEGMNERGQRFAFGLVVATWVHNIGGPNCTPAHPVVPFLARCSRWKFGGNWDGWFGSRGDRNFISGVLCPYYFEAMTKRNVQERKKLTVFVFLVFVKKLPLPFFLPSLPATKLSLSKKLPVLFVLGLRLLFWWCYLHCRFIL